MGWPEQVPPGLPLLWLAGVLPAAALWRILSVVIPAPAVADVATRLGIAAASLLPAAAVLLVMTMTQSFMRLRTSAMDPTAGRDGRFLIVNQRVISNTVEQMAVLTPALMALAAGSPSRDMPKIVAAGLIFAAARLVFWAGYLRAPRLRAPGMAASFLLNAVVAIAAIVVWVA